jgi:hypothetical protein
LGGIPSSTARRDSAGTGLQTGLADDGIEVSEEDLVSSAARDRAM